MCAVSVHTAAAEMSNPCALIPFNSREDTSLSLQVQSLDGVSNIGNIIRKWNGLLSAMEDADHFDIHFPLDMDVKVKAMIFGTCFLIVSLWFWGFPERTVFLRTRNTMP